MNSNLLDFVKTLSLNDTKSLSEKTLKLFEEGGELSDAVLAYNNADGSRHKVHYKKDILEECVDSILVALSIAYSLGYDDDAINSMMHDKSLYWSSLKDLDKSDGRYPFEIHLTLDGTGVPIDLLQKACNEIGNVKLIFLDLYTKEGIQTQITTSSTIYGSLQDAWSEMHRLSDAFKMRGWKNGNSFDVYNWKVVRQKIETVPWHPITINHKNDGRNYFESHLTFIVPPDEKAKVDSYCELYGVHISRNALKHDVEGLSKFMGTLRSHESKELHEIRLKSILQYLANNDVVPTKTITEYSYYDSNEAIDQGWLK